MDVLLCSGPLALLCTAAFHPRRLHSQRRNGSSLWEPRFCVGGVDSNLLHPRFWYCCFICCRREALYEMGMKEKEHEVYFQKSLEHNWLLPLFEKTFGWSTRSSSYDVQLGPVPKQDPCLAVSRRRTLQDDLRTLSADGKTKNPKLISRLFLNCIFVLEFTHFNYDRSTLA